MARIYFVTNRNPDRKHKPRTFGKHLSEVAVDNLRYGWAEVEGGAVSDVHVVPERLHEDEKKARHGSKPVYEALMKSMCGGVDTLVFIHGYNVSFEEALVAGGALHERYRGDGDLNVVVFTWPSDGSVMPLLAYKRDRSDAVASAPAFSRAMMRLRDFLEDVRRGTECKARIHLMCHSMGNYVLRNGIQDLKRGASLPRLFDGVFLMAADEDHDAFEHDHKLAPLPELAQAVHVYFNRGDTALVISDRTKSNPTRLGSHGPRNSLTVPGNVNVVDASEVVHGVIEHDYYFSCPEVVRDARNVMTGLPADKIGRRRYVPSQNRYVLEG